VLEFTLDNMEQENYQYLGYKTFIRLVLKRSKLFFLFLIFSVIFILIGNNIEGGLSVISLKIASTGFLITLFIFLITILIVWLEYINFRFILGDNAFKVRRGVLRKEEVAIPYRQIQNVNIKRAFFDQIIGVSKLIILTAGREDKDEEIWSEAEGVLPSLDKNIARQIQEDLLKRANIERVRF